MHGWMEKSKYIFLLKVIVVALVLGLAAPGVAEIGSRTNHAGVITAGLIVAIVCGITVVLSIVASIFAKIWEEPFG